MTQTRVLVAEPDMESAKAVQQTLKQAGMQVIHVTDGQAAVDTVCQEAVDIILLAVRLPDGHGFDVCRHLRSINQFQPIILLSPRNEERDIVAGIELGADDYVYVPFYPGELLARIFALLRRSQRIKRPNNERKPYQFGEITVDTDKVRVTRGDQIIETTPTEFRLLRYLIEHRNTTCEREALMDHLRGSQSLDITPRTIDVHIRRLRQKLEEDPSNPHWLVTVHGVGYKFVN